MRVTNEELRLLEEMSDAEIGEKMNGIIQIIQNAIDEYGISIVGGKVVLTDAATIEIEKMIAERYEVKAKKRNWCGVPCEW